MDDFQAPPTVFANHVIQQLVHHTMGEDLIIEQKDFLSMRTVFRWLGGSWVLLGEGDMLNFEMLKNIVTAWGQMPGRKKESDEVI
jgi:hypothetical protein